ncbi:Neurofilament heavy protein [Quillaja saponaria]|uniref:Neurofilament heavy protein n=1 Tax=Quillaja saponaria TaxID=32244 RepID=A0AAD7M465_QUISA|nr:Neurofilament heavy protein [Quillaja saponaria]
MEETRSLQIQEEEEEELGDEFYEKIEAPKFVDLKAPDHFRPDDRYWFCLRVGCDQKHEEELDCEEINKNFVLRVMAARSPNVRLRKALIRKEQSTNPKWPLTAPTKSSKSRVTRLALISSVSQKMIDNKLRTRPVSKVSATPSRKVKESSSMAKAFTTPRNQRRLLNPNNFRSVRNPKPTNVVVPKNRVVAKALVFNSPKKAVKTKSSIELNTAMKTLYSAMKKLEINGGKKHEAGKQLPIAASRKQLRGREVKSRVFDSLHSHCRKGQESKSLRCFKKKTEKGLEKSQASLPHEGAEPEHDYSDMEIDEKSRDGSLERGVVSDTSENSKGNENEVFLKTVSVGIISSDSCPGDNDTTSLSSSEGIKTCEESYHEKEAKPNSDKGKIPKAMESDNKENVLGFSDDKENNNLVTENDERENPSTSDDNRIPIFSDGTVLNKHEASIKNKQKSISAATGAQVVKYRKPKPTNPMPFRLRTEERGILKEANMEKKLHAPLKEITSTVPQGGKAPIKKHQKVNQGRIGSTCTRNSMNRKASVITPHGQAVPNYQKPIHLIKQRERCQDKAAQEWKDNLRRKSPIVRPQSVLSTKKKKVFCL